MRYRFFKQYCILLLLMTGCHASHTSPTKIDRKVLPTREETFNTLSQVDLLVIGGGATGAGIALDAAARGLSVLLVEKNDFGSQTSSKSTKLVHGGVRYLEKAIMQRDKQQYKLVTEALQERGVLLHIAPYLVHPIKIISPAYSMKQIPYMWAGLKMYDLIALKERISKSHFISAANMRAEFPHINQEGLKGGVAYYDAQFNDTRMNIALILSAVHLGASALNYTEVIALLKEEGKIVGATIYDTLGQKSYKIHADVVVNATGPFSDNLRKMDDPEVKPLISPSAGTHILIDRKYVGETSGILIPKTPDGRVIFMLPWEGGTVAGTTDQVAELTETPHCTEREMDYLLEHVSAYLSEPITREDVKSVWTGLRPLVRDPTVSDTSKMCRTHMIDLSPSGLVSIMGGKWTTYRRMADETVQAAFPEIQPSQTDQLLLVGSDGFTSGTIAEFAAVSRLDADICEHLVGAYGTLAFEVVKQGSTRRLVPNHPMIEAEISWAVEQEYAQTITDVLARRTRLAFLDIEAAIEAIPRVAALMGVGEDAIEKAREELGNFLITQSGQYGRSSSNSPSIPSQLAPL